MKRASLNHTYRLVWSDIANAFIAVSEITKSKGKKSRAGRSLTVAVSAMLMSGAVFAADLPTGGQIVGGSGTISQSGNVMTIKQTTAKMAADWQSFSIGTGNTVNFVQPSASSVALNRVLGADVSVIQGAINANGQVFLINPNGVLFTPKAQVNVGGIVASTLNMSTADFMAGSYKFEGSSSNAIINQGNITAANGGTIALIAAKITNTGTLTANQGNVLLGAGSKVTLDLGGPVKIQVTQGAIDALIEQGGAIKADGGLVYLTAKAAGDLASTVINHTGITEAQTLATGEKGEIFLMGGMETDRIVVGGKLDASAPKGGDGGFIETSAAKVAFADNVNITTDAANGQTGQWLIDPVDFTVAASGGDITGSALGTLLGSNNVIIMTQGGYVPWGTTSQLGNSGTNGDIFINDSVSWSANKTLTLDAQRNIVVNQAITATGASAGLELKYGQGAVASGNTASYTLNAPINLATGSSFSTKLGSNGTQTYYNVINSASGVDAIRNNLLGNYAIGSNIDLGSISNFVPIGGTYSWTAFTGKLEGLGHTLSNLTINRPTEDGVGLFRYATNSYIGNIGLVNASVTGKAVVGALAATADTTQVVNSFSSGTVQSSGYNTGGLVGRLDGAQGAVVNSYSSATVGSTGQYVGGLIGYVSQGSVKASYATGNVTTTGYFAGGLIGGSYLVAVEDSYATGNVSAQMRAGGLLGVLGGTVARSYSSGLVQTFYNVNVGGLIGDGGTSTSVTNSFWNTETSGQTTSAGGVGKSTAQMKTLATFGGSGGNWTIQQDTNLASTAPKLAWTYNGAGGYTSTWVIGASPLTSLSYSLGTLGANGTLVYKGSDYSLGTLWTSSGIFGSSYSNLALGTDYQFQYSSTPVTGFKNAGTYSNISVVFLNPEYQTAGSGNTAGSITITPKAIALSGVTTNNKVYDATTAATLAGTAAITGIFSGDTVNLSGTASGAFANKNVGTAKTVTVSGLSLTGAQANNYSLTQPASLTANITKANLAVSGLTASNKVYNGNTAVTLTGTASVTPLLTDSLSLGGVATGVTADANAGSAKAVTVSGISLVGQDAGNYTLVPPSGLTTNVAKASLLLTANDFVSSGSATPSLLGQNGCVVSNCISSIGLSSDVLSLNFAGSQLASNYNTTLQVGNAAGRLEVNRPLSWSGFNLMLSAATDIHINSTLTASGVSDKVSLVYGQTAVAASNPYTYRFGLSDTGFAGKLNLQAGQNFDTRQGSNGSVNNWTVVSDRTSLQNINSALSGRYALGANVDASGAEWTALGNATTKFTGQFDGLGHTVSGLTINKSSSTTNDYQGLFGYAIGASLANIGIESASINAARFMGGLLGQGEATNINQSYARNVTLTGERGVGGLVGYLRSTSNVNDSFATGETRGNGTADIAYHGGLVGLIESGNPGTNIRRSFANVNITPTGDASRFAGGLVSLFRGTGVIEDSFALGSVNGDTGGAGGLVGAMGSVGDTTTPQVIRSYASGAVSATGGTTTGGLVGSLAVGTVTNSFWDIGTTGQATSAGGAGAVGKTTEQMQTLSTFAGWNAVYTSASSYSGINDFRQAGIALDGGGQWRMNPRYIPYALSTIGTGNYTYTAQVQTPKEWTSRAVLGDAFADWVLGTDYTFTHASSNVTNFTNAGTYTPVSVTFLRGGAGNYQNATSGNTAGNLTIDKAALTVRANDDARFFTQTDSAGYNGVDYKGFLGSDTTTSALGGTLAIARSDSTNNAVGVYTLSPSGLTANNYAFAYQNGSYQILAADKMLVKAGTVNSIYGEAISYSAPIVQYVAGSDVLTLNATSQNGGSFVFAEAATPGNTVQFTLGPTIPSNSTSGNLNAGLYTLSGTGFSKNTPNYAGDANGVVYSGKLLVAPKAITLDYATPSKTYDATTNFTSTVSSGGVITNDVVNFAGSGTFASKHAGSNLDYTMTVTPAGADAVNYVISDATKSVGDYIFTGSNGLISKANLTVSGLTANNKVYDGTTLASLGGTAGVTALLADSVSLAGVATGVFADRNVANGKAVTVSGLTLSGDDALNYTLIQQSGLTADITPATISAITGITASNKVYDRSTSATLDTSTVGFAGMVAGDKLSLASSSGAFADWNAGNGKTVNISGLSLSGDDVGNYTLGSTTATTTADIYKATISAVTGITSSGKVYDGNTNATITTTSAGFTGIVSGDSLSVASASGAFANKNAGVGKTVNIVDIVLGGTNLANYVLDNTTATTTATITPKALSASATAADRTYDATATAATTLTITGGLVGTETVTASGSASFNSKDVASANLVTVNSTTLADGENGGLAGNYSLAPGQTANASISKALLDVTGLSASSKVYDGTTDVQLTGTATVAALGSDVITLGGTTSASFVTPDIGSNIPVSVSGITLDNTSAGNYLLYTPTLSANITAPVVPTNNGTDLQIQAAVFTAQAVSGSLLSAPSVGSTGGAASLDGASGGSVSGGGSGGVSLSGGLAFVEVVGESSGNSAIQRSPSNDSAGRDASGFMRVFVVAGGINLPSDVVNTDTDNEDSNSKAN